MWLHSHFFLQALPQFHTASSLRTPLTSLSFQEKIINQYATIPSWLYHAEMIQARPTGTMAPTVTIKTRVRVYKAFGEGVPFLEPEPRQGHHTPRQVTPTIQSSSYIPQEHHTIQQPPKSILKRTSHSITTTRKSVQFNALQIKTFPQILGDQCCSSGLPLSLDWAHTSERIIPIEKYESERIPRKRELHLNEFARLEILQCASTSSVSLSATNVDGRGNPRPMYSEAELKRAERRMERERTRTKKRIMNYALFQQTDTAE